MSSIPKKDTDIFYRKVNKLLAEDALFVYNNGSID